VDREHPRPALTADVCVFARDDAGRLRALFVLRGREPFRGRWAFPGGWVVSVAFAGELRWADAATAKGADDADDARWLEIREDAAPPAALEDGREVPLAFDHDEILAAALARLHR
jgi:8-oxo-dGTP diphosphatase